MKLLYLPTVLAVMAALVVVNSENIITAELQPATESSARWTTGSPGLNLNGKMFTLSYNRGGVYFHPPYYSSPSSFAWPQVRRRTNRPYITTQSYSTTYPNIAKPTTTKPTPPKTTTTKPTPPRPTPPKTTTPYPTPRHHWRTTTTYPPWTTPPSTRGVSVCLGYMIDQQANVPLMFTLSPSSRNPLRLGVGTLGQYVLRFDRYGYQNVVLKPYIRFTSNIGPDIWTRVCITVDTAKNVVQVFSGSRMSIRKRLPVQYAWSGEPVLDFSGFDGQMTDVQMWDYPLHPREISYYMNSAVYGPSSGSVLSWSYISYSSRGNALLEDTYDLQFKQPFSSKGPWRRPKGEKKPREFNELDERMPRKRQVL